MKETTAPARPYIGGQAVIEGVMMRAPTGVAVAVRRPDGSLAVREEPLPALLSNKAWKLPLLRGVGMLYESFSLGYSALEWSAAQQDPTLGKKLSSPVINALLAPVIALRSLDERAAEPSPSANPVPPPPLEEGLAPPAEPRSAPSSGSSRLAMVFSTLVALSIFIALPQVLATVTGNVFGLELSLADWQFHALTGTFKLLAVLGYMIAIGSIPEVRRVFQYHGAEHKTIFAYEADRPLTVENVRAQPRLHPRCGTTFLLVVIMVSVVLGSIVTPLVLPHAAGLSGQLQILALRIGLLPAIAAVSYELQRLSARYCTTGPLRMLLWPGFLFQKITTREPDDAQLEVAIASMQTAFHRTSGTSREVKVFGSFDSLPWRASSAH